MITAGGMSKVASLYENAAGMQKKNAVSLKDRERTEAEKAVEKKAAELAEKNAERKKVADKMAADYKVSSGEEKLSDKAKVYLEKLRKTYGDYDFIVADGKDDRRSLVNQSSKEFSVIFSADELEKMASDEEYAQEKLRQMQTAVDMSKRICQEYGFESVWNKTGNGFGTLNKLVLSFNEDGELSIFAELEKVNEKQRERIREAREEKADEGISVKRATVEASSADELAEKIGQIDWEAIAEEKIAAGAKIDFSV